MSTQVPVRDLVVLAADLDIQSAADAVLGRHQSLAIRPIGFLTYRHPGRDPGCLRSPERLLAPLRNQFKFAVVLFDREGCGQEHKPRIELENQVEQRLAQAGWADRCAAVVIDPELEVWVWSDSPHVDSAFGWQGHQPKLRDWLEQSGWWPATDAKPNRPKEAMEAALRYVRKRSSAAIFSKLASGVSLRRCSDPAFEKLKDTLQRWFPIV